MNKRVKHQEQKRVTWLYGTKMREIHNRTKTLGESLEQSCVWFGKS
jgi:hypothetical protein